MSEVSISLFGISCFKKSKLPVTGEKWALNTCTGKLTSGALSRKSVVEVAVTPGERTRNGKKSFHPFVSGRIRFMSVSNPVNPFLVRWCPFRPVGSFEHIQQHALGHI